MRLRHIEDEPHARAQSHDAYKFDKIPYLASKYDVVLYLLASKDKKFPNIAFVSFLVS